MIKSWKDGATRRFAETGKSKFSGLDADKAQARIGLLNAAAALDEISPLRSIGLHKLKGARRHQWAMTINGSWHLVFTFRDGHAYDVEIVDYH